MFSSLLARMAPTLKISIVPYATVHWYSFSTRNTTIAIIACLEFGERLNTLPYSKVILLVYWYIEWKNFDLNIGIFEIISSLATFK